ncbi:hypothetical protein [Conyzicola nivalis]
MSNEASFLRLQEQLAGSGVEMATVFGDQALTVQGKIVAVRLDDGVAFRLGRGTEEEVMALNIPGSGLFDPSRRGHAFRGWVQIPDTAVDTWLGFAQDAIAFVVRTVLPKGAAKD